ncbi:alpha/beta-hydrolase [Mycena amicta]|nr:alpha/beta-hydrolase [Mycena amicta]
MSDPTTWPNLPSFVKSRFLPVNGLRMHILEALPDSHKLNTSTPKPPLVVLLHGFPELAYSWRKVIGPLADAGYHVVAPDQRIYGRTTSAGPGAAAQTEYSDSLAPFRMTNLVKDIVALVYALEYESVAAVVGHDFGSPVAAYCALIRPDLFKSVVMMSAPFTGAPKLNPGAHHESNWQLEPTIQLLADALAKLDPPRKHYVHYCSMPKTAQEMQDPPNGLHAFLREYYHVKSADWNGNREPRPHPMPAADPASIVRAMASLPRYYVMPMEATMPTAIHGCRASEEELKGSEWLTEEELAVYVGEYTRTGFQGGLNWYRIKTGAGWEDDCALFHGKQIEVPAMFVAGTMDWGTYQLPGAAVVMKEKICVKMEDFVLIEGAGHWVQQEKSAEVVQELLRFLQKTRN